MNHTTRRALFIAVAITTNAGNWIVNAAPLEPVNSMHRISSMGFEENKGQVRTTNGEPAPFVKYRLTSGNAQIFLLENGIAYQFDRMDTPNGYEELVTEARRDPDRRNELVAMRRQVRLETCRMDMLLEGAAPNPRITTEGRTADYTNYHNLDALGVYRYDRVTYHDVYPGIDWVIHTTTEGIEYDFVVRPGADPARIRLLFKNTEDLYLDRAGRLVQGNTLGQVVQQAPVSFQNGDRVSSSFLLVGNTVQFALGQFDPAKTLIIDPDLVWATYYGGQDFDVAFSTATDLTGNVFLAGNTRSTSFIAQEGHQNTIGGGFFGDAFLVKLDAGGVRQWATYYGGGEVDEGNSCATDPEGNVYLAGNTSSSQDIAFGGHQNVDGGSPFPGDAPYDAFLAKFDPLGTRLWATYYGGSGSEDGWGCTTDGSGNVYLAGMTSSSTSIAANGFQGTLGGSVDGFLVKFNADGLREWGTYYGGTENDIARSCSADGGNNVYVTGYTVSNEGIAFNGHQNSYGGVADGFLVKFDPNGSRQWATYYGGSEVDVGDQCIPDGNGRIYLVGYTHSPGSISYEGHQDSLAGTSDAFIAKFDTNGVRLWATYYGGTLDEDAPLDGGASCTVDAVGNVYLAGNTNSTDNIAYAGYQNEFGGGNDDAFLVKFTEDGTRIWASYYGGAAIDRGWSCASDANGFIYLAGQSASDVAIASNGFQNAYGGGIADAFLVKFNNTTGLPDPSTPMSGLLWQGQHGTTHQIALGENRPERMELFDATGRSSLANVLRSPAHFLTVDLSGQAPGPYIIAFWKGNERGVVRIVHR